MRGIILYLFFTAFVIELYEIINAVENVYFAVTVYIFTGCFSA